jgi:hypothetical protein
MADVAFAPKNLANGTVPSTKTTVYTVPSGKYAIIRSIVLVPNGTVGLSINLYANFGTGSRRLCPKDMYIAPGDFVEHDISVTLASGDILEVDSSSAGDADYIISGVESV